MARPSQRVSNVSWAGKANAVLDAEITSEREKFCDAVEAELIPETDLVVLAQQDVLEKAKVWASFQRRVSALRFTCTEEDDLLAAVTLLEAREGMAATIHLDAPEDKL